MLAKGVRESLPVQVEMDDLVRKRFKAIEQAAQRPARSSAGRRKKRKWPGRWG